LEEAHAKDFATCILKGNNVTKAGEVGRINVCHKAWVGLLKLGKGDDLGNDNLSSFVVDEF
jgi:hypothetical protein